MKILPALILSFSVVLSPVAAAQERCSGNEISRLKQQFQYQMNSQTSPVVSFPSDKSVTFEYCTKYSDGFVVTGRYHFYGTDGAYYWVDGEVATNRSFAPLRSEVKDANGNFQMLALIKGATVVGVAVAACAATEDCG